jgi:hypothetical protein
VVRHRIPDHFLVKAVNELFPVTVGHCP